MNKKYIIFVVMLCVLVVAFSVFTGFAPQTAQVDENLQLAIPKYIVVTGVANVDTFYLLFSDFINGSNELISSLDSTQLGTNIYRFNIPEYILRDDLYITLVVKDSDRVFYLNRVLFSAANGSINYDPYGVELFQNTVYISEQSMPAWDTLYLDFSVTWNTAIYQALQNELDNVSNQLDIANDTIDTLEDTIDSLQDTIDSLKSGSSALDFVGTAFDKVGDILQIEILPNITIGTIVSVPLILGVVFLILRLVRGE